MIEFCRTRCMEGAWCNTPGAIRLVQYAWCNTPGAIRLVQYALCNTPNLLQRISLPHAHEKCIPALNAPVFVPAGGGHQNGSHRREYLVQHIWLCSVTRNVITFQQIKLFCICLFYSMYNSIVYQYLQALMKIHSHSIATLEYINSLKSYNIFKNGNTFSLGVTLYT